MFDALRSLARRHPAPVARQVTVAGASAWESLLSAHRAEAAEFTAALASLLPLDDALDRYFLEVPVPRAMQDPVRAGVLAAAPPVAEAAGSAGEPGPWGILGKPRQLVQQRERLRERAALAAARAAEALAAVHVANALAFEEVLGHVVGAEDAVVQYIRLFDLPTSTSQVVYQQALARLADRELAAESTAAAVAEPAADAPAPWLRLVGVSGM